jgi:hypothetical protein
MGKDPGILAGIRQRLAAAREHCPLFDTPGLVRALESLFSQIWQDFREGRLHRPDLRNLETYLEIAAALDHESAEIRSLRDYRGQWREKLATFHAARPIPPDRRLWRRS